MQQLTLLELPIAPSTARWIPTGDAVLGRFVAWRSAAFPGITIRRTAHPTALRPYYIPGQQLKHATLAEAQAAVFALVHQGVPT